MNQTKPVVYLSETFLKACTADIKNDSLNSYYQLFEMVSSICDARDVMVIGLKQSMKPMTPCGHNSASPSSTGTETLPWIT